MNFTIKRVQDSDKPWVLEIVLGWGADFIVSRGRKIFPTEIDAYYAETEDGERVGLVTYEIIDKECQVVTLDAFKKFSGFGTALLRAAADDARARGCNRLWLITMNDNLDAIRFYHKRGMTISAIHINALEESRRIKPAIPKFGMHGIPIRDEIEFEMWL